MSIEIKKNYHLNRERLKKVRDMIEFCPEYNFNMEDFGKWATEDLTDPECGTACCLAGFTDFVAKGDTEFRLRNEDHSGNALRYLFGFDLPVHLAYKTAEVGAFYDLFYAHGFIIKQAYDAGWIAGDLYTPSDSSVSLSAVTKTLMLEILDAILDGTFTLIEKENSNV